MNVDENTDISVAGNGIVFFHAEGHWGHEYLFHSIEERKLAVLMVKQWLLSQAARSES